MAHGTNILHSIKLPNGTTYDIYDASAIHSVGELGIAGALIFKGTKEYNSTTKKTGATQILELTGVKVGEVYLDKDTNAEYVCVTEIGSTANASAWEKLGKGAHQESRAP